METRQIKIRFYVGYVGPTGDDGLVSEALLDLANRASCPCMDYGDVHYQIRGLHNFNDGRSFRGIFAKLRKRDIPHIGSTEGAEREITIENNEGVIEKNYFLYFKDRELLVYQSNHNGSTVEAFGKYFSQIMNYTTVFHPILKTDSMKRIMRPDFEPTRIELKVAKPTNPDFYPADDWSAHMLALVNEMGGASIGLSISAGGRGRNRGRLATAVKHFVSGLASNGSAEVAKISAVGLEHPIDLIADRIIVTRTVQMNGRYPSEPHMFSALLGARDESKHDLDGYFGENNALDR